ncbi:hypothetical protein MNBD_GAMMA06-802 [hydrothermal vent metagenome]|uniref:Uncharacterized protein n=1 Tax=hydrothermal vent metagenome TaxID=652676 RepID=A0A3B0WJR0_9ZZZZ
MKNLNHTCKAVLLAFSTLATSAAIASAAAIPNTFSSGTAAIAVEVNDNFTALKSTIDDNDSRITALNHIKKRGNAIVVKNRSHRAEFTQHGVLFTPTQGPNWHWQLQDDLPPSVQPVVTDNAIDYIHQNYTERYLLKTNSIEQRFIIEQPYQAKKDLIIEGKINSKGKFETTATGWLWRDKQGVVSLGQVTVFDANGKILPATMHTEATFSRITVAANVLKTAVYPVTIDPEIGSNDFLIGSMNGNADFDAFEPAVSYNANNNEYLVVWSGHGGFGTLRNIYGQRIDASTGTLLGASAFLISSAGGAGDVSKVNPAVSYSSNDNEYFVVWAAGNTGVLNGKFINAATEALLNDNDLLIASMNGARNPAISYSATSGQHLVVWSSSTIVVADNEIEIHGQRFNATSGNAIGATGFRISNTAGPVVDDLNATNPAISYNATNNEYLVVWRGGSVEFEIHGQRINAANGAERGTNDFRLSDMGQVDGEGFFSADDPAVSYNAMENEYLVVWAGDDVVGNEREIYGQRINAATGAEIGENDFRLSDMGPDNDSNFDANDPDVSYNASNNEYLVIWRGDDNLNSLDNEFEIFAQRINATTAAEIGDNDFRLSDIAFDVKSGSNSAVSYNTTNEEYLVVWAGDETDNKDEIFGQRFDSPLGDNGDNGDGDNGGGNGGNGGGGSLSWLLLSGLFGLIITIRRNILCHVSLLLH